MNRSETDEYLYKYFRKLSASFQSSLYKAAITGDIEDIHKARVDVKKINALFILFETVSPGFSSKTQSCHLFKDLFRTAGTIREIQLMLLYLESKNDPDPVLAEFQKWLIRRNQTQIRQFLKSVIGFDKNALKDLAKSVKKLLGRVSKKQLLRSSMEMIYLNSLRVKYLVSGWDNPENIHRIRRYVKAVGAVTNQILEVSPDAGLDQLRRGVTSTEEKIGGWHDQVVFIYSMNRFMKTPAYLKASSHSNFLALRDQLMNGNAALLENLHPEIKSFVILINKLSRKKSLDG
jgi:CHAD domain-containing protein